MTHTPMRSVIHALVSTKKSTKAVMLWLGPCSPKLLVVRPTNLSSGRPRNHRARVHPTEVRIT